MTKHAELRLILRRAFSDIIHTTNTIDETDFNNIPESGKWSVGEIIGHLVLSTKTITKALTTPKPILESSFGKITRKEWSKDELTTNYNNALSKGLKAPKTFTFIGAKEKGKEKILSLFNRELDHLLDAMDKWNEHELTEYALPHPALGKMSLKEMILFTEFHTKHHHVQILNLLNHSQEITKN